MMYASKNDITHRFQKSRLPYKFWLAHYTSSTDYTGSYQMWQRTSKGSVPGISGYVDMNIAYFGYGSAAKPKHTHDFENGTVIGKIVEPTCAEAGYKMMRCKECSESQKVELPATGKHQFGEWEVDEENSKEGAIVLVRTCSACKKTETKTTKERPTTNTVTNNTVANEVDNNVTTNSTTTNETVVPPTTNDNEEPPAVEPPHEHVLDDGTITKPATCTEEGEKVYKCIDETCGYEKTETIEKAEHTYNDENVCSVCGQSKPQE